jgi:hypothetical protein
MLRWALGRLAASPDEKARLEREEFEAKGFVSNIERMLVAVDASPSGRFASRLRVRDCGRAKGSTGEKSWGPGSRSSSRLPGRLYRGGALSSLSHWRKPRRGQ